MKSPSTFVQESMSSSELSDLQNEHYALDNQLRGHTQKMTPDQKRQLCDAAAKIVKGS